MNLGQKQRDGDIDGGREGDAVRRAKLKKKKVQRHDVDRTEVD